MPRGDSVTNAFEPRQRVYVIAEAGVNHNGSLETATELVRAAKLAGADAVKFQAFRAEALASPRARKADYQARETGGEQSQLDMLRALEFGEDEHRVVLAVGREIGIDVLSSAFDLEALAMLARLGITTLKVPSGEITNLPYLRAVASAAGGGAGQVILSTGMADLAEVGAALEVLERGGVARDDITLLHCTTEYPAPSADVNLNAMMAMRDKFGVAVGYSDHTVGSNVATAAVALGAVVIEKHLTLDRALRGPDHRASLEPAELAEMIARIREVELALGSAEKRPTAAEVFTRGLVRKSIVASCGIRAGELLSASHLTTKRPGKGVSPMRWDQVIGTTAVRDFAPDEEIEL
jgi:N,N'-diacetyllegionaminate synthase